MQNEIEDIKGWQKIVEKTSALEIRDSYGLYPWLRLLNAKLDALLEVSNTKLQQSNEQHLKEFAEWYNNQPMVKSERAEIWTTEIAKFEAEKGKDNE